MELFSLIGLIVALAAALGGIVLLLRVRRRPLSSSPAELVRRRQALRDELRALVPDQEEFDRIVRGEARRLGVSETSVQAYEAAVARTVKAGQPPRA